MNPHAIEKGLIAALMCIAAYLLLKVTGVIP